MTGHHRDKNDNERKFHQHGSRATAAVLQKAHMEVTERAPRRTTDISELDEGYRFLFNSDLVPVWIVDPRDLAILAVNRAMADRFGYTEEELLSMVATDLLPHEQTITWPGNLNEDSDAFFRGTWKYITKSGFPLYMEVRSQSINLHGQCAQLIVANDVTEWVTAVEKVNRLQSLVKQSETDWRLTFDAITSPLFIVDAKGGLKRINRAASNLCKSGHRILIGLNFKNLASREPLKSLFSLFTQVSSSRPFESCQVRDETSGTSWEISATRIEEFENTGEHVVLLARDVSRIIKLEASLQHSERLSTIGSLVAGVAHEVRNPLFGIGSTLDALELRLGHGHVYERHVAVLRQELERLNELMSELLELGKLPSEKLYDGDIGQLAAQAISYCEPLARQHGVILLNLIDQKLPSVKMDRRRMVQVFLNLIENAIHYSPTGSSVKIKAGIAWRGGQKWISFWVADSGPGIDPGDMDRIFEPFFTRRRKGSGLGLSIVHRIVEEHLGKIEASNSPNGGAVFTVSLLASTDETVEGNP
jgi:PAS domain S-box-containing protein